MSVRLVNIGYSNSVSAGRIVAVVGPDAAPIKRLIQDAKDEGMCVDATCGRRMRAVVIMDSGHVILSSVKPSTVGLRLEHGQEDDGGE